MTPAEKEKLYKAIGYEENAAEEDIPEHYEAITMNFKLIALEIGVYDDSKSLQSVSSTTPIDFKSMKNILLLNFSLATCNVKQRPAGNALSLTVGMKEMTLTGLKKDNFEPIIIKSQITEESNLLDVFFETNPLDKVCNFFYSSNFF